MGQEQYGDLTYLNMDVTDESGTVESNADRKIEVQVEGGKLLAAGSANPRTEESYRQSSFTTYYGRAQAVVRRNTGCKVQVSCENLKSVSLVL